MKLLIFKINLIIIKFFLNFKEKRKSKAEFKYFKKIKKFTKK